MYRPCLLIEVVAARNTTVLPGRLTVRHCFCRLDLEKVEEMWENAPAPPPDYDVTDTVQVGLETLVLEAGYAQQH
jgi:hypothetical protein